MSEISNDDVVFYKKIDDGKDNKLNVKYARMITNEAIHNDIGKLVKQKVEKTSKSGGTNFSLDIPEVYDIFETLRFIKIDLGFNIVRYKCFSGFVNIVVSW